MITIFYYVVACFDIIHDRNNRGALPCKHGGSKGRSGQTYDKMRENFPLCLIQQCGGVEDMVDLTSDIIQCMQAVYSCTFTITRGMSHKVTGVTSDILPGEGATSDKMY